MDFIGKKYIFVLCVTICQWFGMSVEVGKYGRIVLPKRLREKYGVHEGIRLIITEYEGRICLVPVETYKKPTEALYGSVVLTHPVDEPKQLAREYIRKKLVEDFQ
jgi:AbrB family looped-hinge helix DNA binding protein